MRTVRDDAGDLHVLLRESSDESLVRALDTGERRYVDTDALEPVTGESPLVAAARSQDGVAGDVLARVPDQRAVGLLVELHASGPLSVRSLLAYDLCESDLHGLLAELRAAGLVEERDVAGERGYALTETAADALVAATA